MTPLPTWNRAVLFSSLDTRVRRRRRRAETLVLAISMFALPSAASLLAYLAMHEVTTVFGHPAAKVGSSTPVLPPGPECREDHDCALRPSVITCCGTCPPARPFEAASVAELERVLRVADDACRPAVHYCEPLVCPVEESGVPARAVCAANHCIVIEP